MFVYPEANSLMSLLSFGCCQNRRALTRKHAYTCDSHLSFWPFSAARHSSAFSLSDIQDLDGIGTKRDNLQVYSVQRLQLSRVNVQILNPKHLSHCQKVYTTNCEFILMSCPSWLKSCEPSANLGLSPSWPREMFTRFSVRARHAIDFWASLWLHP